VRSSPLGVDRVRVDDFQVAGGVVPARLELGKAREVQVNGGAIDVAVDWVSGVALTVGLHAEPDLSVAIKPRSAPGKPASPPQNGQAWADTRVDNVAQKSRLFSFFAGSPR